MLHWQSQIQSTIVYCIQNLKEKLQQAYCICMIITSTKPDAQIQNKTIKSPMKHLENLNMNCNINLWSIGRKTPIEEVGTTIS